MGTSAKDISLGFMASTTQTQESQFPHQQILSEKLSIRIIDEYEALLIKHGRLPMMEPPTQAQIEQIIKSELESQQLNNQIST